MEKIYIDKKEVEKIVKAALKEDVGPKDVTTSAAAPRGIQIRAHIISKAEGIVSGLPVCESVFSILDPDTRFKPQLGEGESVHEGQVIAYVEGDPIHILSGERTALNFLSRLSAISTKTKSFVRKVSPVNVKIMDTRKTTPGLRYLEKYAVRAGGGYNHRYGLWDQVLIKDNHIEIHKMTASDKSLAALVRSVRGKVQRNIKIEIEVATLKEFEDALGGKPDIIMLDNMTPTDVKRAVVLRNKTGKNPLLEVSGNINLDNVLTFANYGVDMISIGSLTHSVESIDLSLEIDATV